jgi:hypothetical protein
VSAKRWWWLACVALVAAAVAVILIPALVIQPFRPQSPRALELSYVLKRFAPSVTIVAVLGVFFAAARLWRTSRWWSRTALVLLLVLVSGTAWASRQNPFEWMFRPLPAGAYAPASAATFVDAADLVIAVDRNGEAAAYPIRQLAYHHVVQDTVGRVPIVVTY